MRHGADFQANTQRVFLVPPAEAKCVLMTAGLISYRLCNRGYDCEHCPLYQAFREGCVAEQCPEDVRQRSLYLHLNLGHEIARAGYDDPRLATLLKPYERMVLRRRLFYAPGHAWVDVRTLTQARVGADDFLALTLPQVDAIVPPAEGQTIRQGEPLVGFVVRGEWVPLVSPLSGTVIKTNAKVLTNPSLLHQDPYGEGWLVEMQSSDLPAVARELRYDEDSVVLFREDAEALFSEIAHALVVPGAPVGTVSQDGGQPAATPAEALGTRRYTAILRKILECSIRRFRGQGKPKQEGREP